MLVNYLQEVDTKCMVIVSPPFLYYELEDKRPVMTLSDIMWKRAKSSVVHLVKVPGIQIKWKKHQEVLTKHTFIVYDKWEDLEEYRKVIKEAKENGNEEEKRIKEYADYQLQKLWMRSKQNIKLLKNAKKESGCNIFFIETKGDYSKITQ